MRLLISGLLVVGALVARVPYAAAAQSYDNCTGYITSLPAVIAKQGTWCMRNDLSTAIGSGAALTIAANNVTLDCNDFKIGGLAAGVATQTVGIESMQRSNVTIRRCNVRGFWIGIDLAHDASEPIVPPSGNVVEDNRVDGSTRIGVVVGSDAAVVRNNIVTNTGGNPHGDNPVGIQTFFGVDIVDNLIDGIYEAPGATGQSYGIMAWTNGGGSISRNRLRGITSSLMANGIVATIDSQVSISDNTLMIPTNLSYAIQCHGEGSVASRNVVMGPGAGLSGCIDGGGNVAP
jgi:hypothetical protein